MSQSKRKRKHFHTARCLNNREEFVKGPLLSDLLKRRTICICRVGGATRALASFGLSLHHPNVYSPSMDVKLKTARRQMESELSVTNLLQRHVMATIISTSFMILGKIWRLVRFKPDKLDMFYYKWVGPFLPSFALWN